MVAAGQSVGLTVIVRVADPDPTLIAIAIDAKADGVLVPYCEDAEMIKRCAWKTALHPLKGKAFEDVLNSEKFPSKKTKDYLNKRNGHRIFIVGIESITAVNNLDNLINLSQGPIDGVFVGPNDLSTSMGIPDELENSDYLDALTKIINVSESHNIPVMVHGFTPERTLKTMELGARFVLHSSDGGMITQSIDREFNSIRDEKLGNTKNDAI
jgi:4-hydroxy-2-oxoheptanedioate aldolase